MWFAVLLCMFGPIETALTRFISAGPVWLAPNIRNRLCLSDGVRHPPVICHSTHFVMFYNM